MEVIKFIKLRQTLGIPNKKYFLKMKKILQKIS